MTQLEERPSTVESAPSTVPQDYAELNATTRREIPENRFEIAGVDHTGIPCRDVERSGRFYEEVLGAVLAYRAGFSQEEQQRGRPKHCFYFVGSQLIEVVPAYWGERAYVDKASEEANPHWAFATTPRGLMALKANMDRNGIPYSGPRSHSRATAVSIYFVDPDGNKLEVTTYDPLPPEMEITPIGGKFGGVSWSKLQHDWQPRP